jgi:hypothetical protein
VAFRPGYIHGKGQLGIYRPSPLRRRQPNSDYAYLACVLDFLGGIAVDLGSNHSAFAERWAPSQVVSVLECPSSGMQKRLRQRL